MYKRLCEPLPEQPFFLFGARGTGKSTLLKALPFLKSAVWFDLLKPETESELARRPETLNEVASALRPGEWIVIDEVQKIPSLLSLVHHIIEEKRINFALTGSSSRKLRRGSSDLLAGRAVVYPLYPLSFAEMKGDFEIHAAMNWGTLPLVTRAQNPKQKKKILDAYVHTYLKEEILVEQLIRKLDPFRNFLPVAAQMDSEITNFSKIASDVGVDYKTVQKYYEILVETYLGFFLEPFDRSVRRVQTQSPKFYFFDVGVKRSLERKLSLTLQPGTSEFGHAFESFFINECLRLNSYGDLDFKFSYLRTKDNVEVDLIVQKPNGDEILVEIKSASAIAESHVKSLAHFASDFPKARLICACLASRPKMLGRVEVLPWQIALREIGLI